MKAEHLRGGPHYAHTYPDALAYGTAQAQAAKIRQYWAKRGLYPAVRVIPLRETDNVGGPNDYQVRSDMVGGRPRVWQ